MAYLNNITSRHEFILTTLKKNNRSSIRDLCKLTGVSGVTIRKDLKFLEDKGLLYRIKGGASINNPYAMERPINEKELINSDQKKSIAKAATGIIGETDAIIIGSGTTVFALARMLHPRKQITVITPALKVALELSNRSNVEIYQLGGLLRPNSSSVTGDPGEKTLSEISCGIVFLGVDGIDLKFGMSITNLAEANLNKRMIASSNKVAILADSSKFGRHGMAKICDFNEVDYIITDRNAPRKSLRQLEKSGIQIIIAD